MRARCAGAVRQVTASRFVDLATDAALLDGHPARPGQE
jgi:hypothetical protein